MSLGDNSGESSQSYQNSIGSTANRSLHSLRRSYLIEKAARDATVVAAGSTDSPPLLEIPEEIYAVRKAALRVLKPLTRTWVRSSVAMELLNGRCLLPFFILLTHGHPFTTSS
jgi:hypothetical protein